MSLYHKIKSHFFLPDAFSDWTNYRNTLTNYLITQTNQISLSLSFHPGMTEQDLLPTLAILGAGACNDLNLEVLSSHFSKITLIDYDTASMQNALKTYHLQENPIIELLPVSLNGLMDADYQQFCEQLQIFTKQNLTSVTAVPFETYALSLLENCYKKSRQASIPLLPASYDYIWCFGIHSQLQAMFSYIYNVFIKNLQEIAGETFVPSSFDHFTNRLKEENNYFIPKLHDALLKCAKQAVFIGCEQRRTGSNEPIEGAYQAILDIRSRKLPLEESILLWPFCPEKQVTYEMLIQKITISNSVFPYPASTRYR